MPFVTIEGGWVEHCPVHNGGKELQLTNGAFITANMDDPITKIVVFDIQRGGIDPTLGYTENAVPRFRILTDKWTNETWEWFLNSDDKRNLHNCVYTVSQDDFKSFDKIKKPFEYPVFVLEEIYRKGLVPKEMREGFLEALNTKKLEVGSNDDFEVSSEDGKSKVSAAKETKEDAVISEVESLVDPNKELVAVSRRSKRG